MKKVYQIIYDKMDDGKFNRNPFYSFLEKELNAIHIFSNVYWIETEMTPTEISDKLYTLTYHGDKIGDHWYIMELSPNMDCWMASSHVNWLKERLNFNK